MKKTCNLMYVNLIETKKKRPNVFSFLFLYFSASYATKATLFPNVC